MKKFKEIFEGQSGLTLVELLIAIAIGGIIGAAISVSIFQVGATNVESSKRMVCVKQVENSIHWIRKDVQMAQIVETGESSGFPLKLTWIEWDNTLNEITYSLENNQIKRSHSVNGTAPSDITIANHIDSGSEMTNCQFMGRELNLKITASISGFRPVSEIRVVRIISRTAM